ncbi:hypothetical protein HaLaN_27155, partial [Haematococcus lacustris]
MEQHQLCDFVEVVGVRRDLAPLVARLGGMLLALLTPQLAGQWRQAGGSRSMAAG